MTKWKAIKKLKDLAELTKEEKVKLIVSNEGIHYFLLYKLLLQYALLCHY